jgi:hypothetical protein
MTITERSDIGSRRKFLLEISVLGREVANMDSVEASD